MRINTDNGAMTFSGGSMCPAITRDEFLAGSLATDARAAVVNEPWITYEFWPEAMVAASAVFEDSTLVELRFMLAETGDLERPLNEHDEIRRKSIHDEWLSAQLGSGPYNFPWGSIESDFDPRSLCSQIIVRYPREPMSTLTFEGRNLVVDSRKLTMPCSIKDAFQLGGRIIVLLDPDDNLTPDRQFHNLMALDAKGDIAWMAELPTGKAADTYCRIVSRQPLRADSFCSYECEIDLDTGKIVSRRFFK